jgi:hypothetical protein
LTGDCASAAIREWRQTDAADLARLADDRAVWLGLRDVFPHPYGLEKCGYRLEGTMRQSAIKDGVVLDQWMYAITRDALDPR